MVVIGVYIGWLGPCDKRGAEQMHHLSAVITGLVPVISLRDAVPR
jgi:hypothetical protein